MEFPVKLKHVFAAVALAGAMLAQPASAQIAGPLPANSFIFFGGYDWAWASPCNTGGVSPGCSTLTLQGGFRYATGSEWMNHPEYLDFVDPAGNANGAQNGVRIRCATAYFDNTYSHCDDANFMLGGDYQVASGVNGSQVGYAETLLIRTVAPEPASMALVGAGLLAMAGFARRRRVR